MNNKMRMDALVNKHYNELIKISGGVSIRKSGTNKTLRYDLLHETLIDIYKDIENNNSFLKTDSDFLNYLKAYLKNYYYFDYKNCVRDRVDKKLNTYRPDIEESVTQYLIDSGSKDDHTEQIILLQCENINDDTKDFLGDIIKNDLTVDRGLQFLEVMNLFDNNILNEREKYLFHAMFLDGQNAFSIYKDLKGNKGKNKTVGYHRIRNEVKELREKIIKILND